MDSQGKQAIKDFIEELILLNNYENTANSIVAITAELIQNDYCIERLKALRKYILFANKGLRKGNYLYLQDFYPTTEQLKAFNDSETVTLLKTDFSKKLNAEYERGFKEGNANGVKYVKTKYKL